MVMDDIVFIVHTLIYSTNIYFCRLIDFLWLTIFFILFFQNDERSYFSISTFGFYRDGRLKVKVDKLRIVPDEAKQKASFEIRRRI